MSIFVQVTKDMSNEKVLELLALANSEAPELSEDEQIQLLLGPRSRDV